jgi:hypothetical protein
MVISNAALSEGAVSILARRKHKTPGKTKKWEIKRKTEIGNRVRERGKAMGKE